MQGYSIFSDVSYNVQQQKQLEMERLREEQRRREYELKVEAERRKLAEHERRVGVRPAQEKNTLEEQRIEELRRRDEELRRNAAKRREEERRRAEEEERKRDQEEERRREEQRRLDFGRREEERIREEQRREEERRKMDRAEKERIMGEEMNKEEDTTTSKGGVTDTNAVPEGDDWDYGSDEDVDATDDYLHADKELEGVEATDKESIDHGSDDTVADEAEKPGHNQQLDGIIKVIEAAAEETTTTDGHEDDDYWDHSIKRDDEEYEVPKVVDSEEDRELSPTKPAEGVVVPTGKVREFAAEEGEEGWMMMKRVDENSSPITLSATVTALFLIMRIF
ncbi:unnamed protein product [Strongylus vulgaris]|uniref:Uncharacterized protein n=1 Tax=Strongylus vulgaris TaxID=40348 RepID=A0A3P7LFZ7_STRVU|nr:unnamed protein product [Strongylus vulgaris]